MMRFRILALITIWSLLCLPSAAATSTASGTAETAIGTVLDNLHLAASNADGDLYFSLFTEHAVFIGTDASERWSIEQFRTFAEPYFSKGQGWTYVPRERHIHILPSGAAARFDEILSNESYGTCRGTGVVELIDNAWYISQYSLTIPIPNELARDIVRRIKKLEATTEQTPAEQSLTIFLVRHAEKIDESRNPDLSPSGLLRAKQLNDVLRDAQITHIHSSDFIRTQDTAAPLAKRLGLEVELYDPNDLRALVKQLTMTGGRHLVVGHSNTTPAVVELLGGDPGAGIEVEGEYDRLYIVTSDPNGHVNTTMMRYGYASMIE